MIGVMIRASEPPMRVRLFAESVIALIRIFPLFDRRCFGNSQQGSVVAPC
jgi:hypothetical protein